jgi:hypothetical protein
MSRQENEELNGEFMSQFLVAIHHPDTFQSSDESAATVRARDA